MKTPNTSEVIHKAWLYRLLSSIAEDSYLIESLRFKGGTCLAMQGFLDRFSVDLDFDLLFKIKNKAKVQEQTKKNLEKIFKKLNLQIHDSSSKVPEYFLKYPRRDKGRSTIKLDVTFPAPLSNVYEPVRFSEIDKIIFCQTKETMFSNKLVALIERYEKNRSIAGRDLYDIQAFYLKNIQFDEKVIYERRKASLKDFFLSLRSFIEEKVTQKIIDQDLNSLVSKQDFNAIRKSIKNEVLMFINSTIDIYK
jgi:predicted nucleotidyltransferase component of viral defense system